MPNNTLSELLTTSWTGPADPRSNSQPSTLEAETSVLIPPAIGQSLDLGGVSQGTQTGTSAPSEHDLQVARQEQPTSLGAPFGEEEIRKLAGTVGVYRPTGAAAALHTSSVSLETRQYWEGRVISVRDNEFVAVVQDLSNAQNPDEEIVFGLDEISDVDRSLLQSGAGFYWFIGRERTRSGQQKNVSFIQFKRTPGLSRSALVRAKKTAQRFRAVMGPTKE